MFGQRDDQCVVGPSRRNLVLIDFLRKRVTSLQTAFAAARYAHMEPLPDYVDLDLRRIGPGYFESDLVLGTSVDYAGTLEISGLRRAAAPSRDKHLVEKLIQRFLKFFDCYPISPAHFVLRPQIRL